MQLLCLGISLPSQIAMLYPRALQLPQDLQRCPKKIVGQSLPFLLLKKCTRRCPFRERQAAPSSLLCLQRASAPTYILKP